MNNPLVITGMGLITPVGLNAVQSCASIRAGISRSEVLEDYYYPELKDPEWDDEESGVGARVGILDLFHVMGQERKLKLMQWAFQDLQESTSLQTQDFEKRGFFLSVSPPNLDKLTETSPIGLLESFQQQASLHFLTTQLFPYGHTGVYQALEEAQKRIQQGELESCLIGAVDSLLDLPILDWLDQKYRFKSTRNRDALIPGEACGFFLVESMETALQREAPIFAIVGGIGTAMEEFPLESDHPSRARGLTQAISKAIQADGTDPSFSWVQCDLNGESYRSKEWGMVYSRLGNYFQNLEHLDQHVSSIGDVGAASGAVSTILAACAFDQGYAKDRQVLLWSSSDGGERSAIILKQFQKDNDGSNCLRKYEISSP